jgi:hypothetical protein
LAGSGLPCRILKKFLHQEWVRGPSAVLAPEAGMELLRSAGAIIQKVTPIHQQMGLLRAPPQARRTATRAGRSWTGKRARSRPHQSNSGTATPCIAANSREFHLFKRHRCQASQQRHRSNGQSRWRSR